MVKQIYTCDICGKEYNPPEECGFCFVPLGSMTFAPSIRNYKIIAVGEVIEGSIDSHTLDLCPECQRCLNNWVSWMKGTKRENSKKEGAIE